MRQGFVLSLFVLAAGFAMNVHAQNTSPAAGVWSGIIQLPSANLPVTVTLTAGSGGSWSGTIDIPAQNLRGASLNGITVAGQAVAFHIANIPGDPTFKGTMSADRNSLSGNMTQNGASFGFQLAKGTAQVAGTKVTGDATPLEGRWQGALEGLGQTLHLMLKVSRSTDGPGFTVELDSQEQNARGLRVDTLDVTVDKVRFHMPLGASFEGTFNSNKSQISGVWTQGAASAPLLLQKAATQGRAQEPKPPFLYKSEDVVFRNSSAGIKLAGTLTLPSSGGPFPAVLLISGSGAQDRDETIFDHKPFLVLADHLTRAGIAVLRVDDRGVGGSDRGPVEPTSEDFAGDVRAGVDYLRSRSDIAKSKIGLIGHSEGGIIAPMVAASSQDIAFIVLMAGPGLKGEDLMYLQGAYALRAQGASESTVQWNRSLQERLFKLVNGETPGKPDEAARKTLVNDILPDYMQHLGIRDEAAGRSAIDAQLRAVSSPWFRFFLKYDPAPTLSSVRCPVLALIGENDVQVPYKENLPAIKAALQRGGNRDFTATSIPKLNHLFQTSVTGAPSEYATIQETFAPSAMETMSRWILRHTR